MNAELARRWRAGEAPFHGATLAAREREPVALVRLALRPLVELLALRFAEATLFRGEDRYATEGLETAGSTTSWAELRSWLVSDQALFLARSGEPEVRTIVYPADYSFLLRFYVDHETRVGESLDGHWDFTASPALLELARTRLEDCGESGWIERSALP